MKDPPAGTKTFAIETGPGNGTGCVVGKETGSRIELFTAIVPGNANGTARRPDRSTNAKSMRPMKSSCLARTLTVSLTSNGASPRQAELGRNSAAIIAGSTLTELTVAPAVRGPVRLAAAALSLLSQALTAQDAIRKHVTRRAKQAACYMA